MTQHTKPEGYYGDPASMLPDKSGLFPELTEEQVALRESERARHQANVDSIQRRGLHERIVAKLRHWEVLEGGGYPMGLADKAEVVLLKTMLAEVVQDMEAAGQPA